MCASPPHSTGSGGLLWGICGGKQLLFVRLFVIVFACLDLSFCVLYGFILFRFVDRFAASD